MDTGAWLLIAFGLAVYFAPAIVAANRDHPRLVPIVVVDLFLGWTLIGWVGALAWAFSNDARDTSDGLPRRDPQDWEKRTTTPHPGPSASAEASAAAGRLSPDAAAQLIASLKNMVEQGLISAEQFDAKRAEILARI